MDHADAGPIGEGPFRKLVAIVPVKPLAEGKHRLADVLAPEARQELSRQLFEHTLDVLARARGVSQIAIVSRDERVLALARDHQAWAIREAQEGLNQALEQATSAAIARGATAVLIVPTDLPWLEPADIEQILALGREPPCVVVAPSQRDAGTNALLVAPAGLITYAFGPSSSIEHERRAERAGARLEICRSDRIAFDLDTPDDVRALPSRFPSF